MENNTKKTVLITGSTQGIGKALAEGFVKQGYNVIVHCSRDLEKAERVRREIGAYQARKDRRRRLSYSQCKRTVQNALV